MAYSAGGLIEASDYNLLAWGGDTQVYRATPTNIAYVMGVGNGEYGYGQSVSGISVVAETNTVTATQWSGLLNLLNVGLGHQSGAGAQLTVSPAITAGNEITHFSSIQTAVGTINTNRQLFTAQGSTVTGTTHTVTMSAAATSALNSFVDANVVFASAQHARYFFNAGGKINYRISATDNASTTRSQSVRDLVNNAGGINTFGNFDNGGRSGTGGTIDINATATGYRDLIDGEVTGTFVVRATDAAPYSGAYARIAARRASTDTTSGANGTGVVFRSRVYAPADDAFGGTINLTFTSRVDIIYPETTYLTSSWGTPTITFDQT